MKTCTKCGGKYKFYFDKFQKEIKEVEEEIEKKEEEEKPPSPPEEETGKSTP